MQALHGFSLVPLLDPWSFPELSSDSFPVTGNEKFSMLELSLYYIQLDGAAMLFLGPIDLHHGIARDFP